MKGLVGTGIGADLLLFSFLFLMDEWVRFSVRWVLVSVDGFYGFGGR